MIIKRHIKMYNITIHNAQHLCRIDNVAKHSVRYNGVLHFDPASLTLKFLVCYILSFVYPNADT